MKRLLLYFMLLTSCTAKAVPQQPITPTNPDNIKTYFVQIWTEKQRDSDMTLYEAEDPGRLEVYEGNDVNNTVACVQFRSVKDWNSDQLANISVGFTYHGDKSKLHTKLYGAANRLVKIDQKITEKPVPSDGG